MATLIFTLEDGEEIVVPVYDVVTLGSENGNDVVVDDVEVSARHAEVRKVADGEYEVIDLNSASGTFVNDVRVQSWKIGMGDKLGFGPLRGIFQVDEAPPAAQVTNTPNGTQTKENTSSAKRNDQSVEAKVEIEKLLADQSRLQEGMTALQTATQEEQSKLEGLLATTAKAESTCREQEKHLNKLNAQLAESQARLRTEAAELDAKMELLSQLRADEKKLEQATHELRDAESKHSQWLEAIHALGDQHDHKSAEVQRLTSAADNTLRDLEMMNAHKEEALGHLQSLRQERASYEESLPSFRQQSAELESRCRESQVLAEAREDQVIRAEKKIAALDCQRVNLEQRVTELSGATQHFEKVKEDCTQAESRHTTLIAEIAALVQNRQNAESVATALETRIVSLKNDANTHRDAVAEITVEHHRLEELSRLIQSQKEAHESDCAAANKKLSAVCHELEQTGRKHAELLRRCEELAGTDIKLTASKTELNLLETRRGELHEVTQELEAQLNKHTTILDDLCREEANATGRLSALVASEKDIRLVLEELGNREKECRSRFEEIQKLAADAEREYADQVHNLKQGAEQSQRELADLEIKLAPLRDWKEAMDKRYARLASLPEDSAEARDLWHEIEQEKAGLRNLISPSLGSTRAINLNASVLTQLISSDQSASDSKNPALGKGRLHAPPPLTDELATHEERANVGQTGTGQEIALKARINRLRESVQREAARLEFLRQERAREETRGKGGSASDSMMREQERQLDSKVRREEERFATLQRKLELAEMEEEKRREKIADMERKITELRADITEAERKRSDARHQADLTQAELKNYEAALDRVKKLVEV